MKYFHMVDHTKPRTTLQVYNKTTDARTNIILQEVSYIQVYPVGTYLGI